MVTAVMADKIRKRVPSMNARDCLESQHYFHMYYNLWQNARLIRSHLCNILSICGEVEDKLSEQQAQGDLYEDFLKGVH